MTGFWRSSSRLLAQQLKDLSLSGLDFSLEVVGFEMAKIGLRIGRARRSARTATYGFSIAIACAAAMRWILRLSRY
jgi:hypothetical protein